MWLSDQVTGNVTIRQRSLRSLAEVQHQQGGLRRAYLAPSALHLAKV